MKLRLDTDTEYKVVDRGLSIDTLYLEIISSDSFEDIEQKFLNLEEIIYLVSEDSVEQSFHGFTRLDGIRKNNNEEITYSIVLKKETEYELLKKRIINIELGLTELIEQIIPAEDIEEDASDSEEDSSLKPEDTSVNIEENKGQDTDKQPETSETEK